MNAAHTRYAIPLALEPRLILRSDSGAEAWGLWKGGAFAGRIERPGVPLPGRLPWGLYGPDGELLQRDVHPKVFPYQRLGV
jgi:hypothetical protein